MGADHTYRYVNTNGVPNSNSGTYTYPANSTGGTYDMGTTNTYRYVNASNVYNKGKADGGGCTLLWTNSNPTGAFNEQTLSLDLTNYDGLLICFIGRGNDNINLNTYYGTTVCPIVYVRKMSSVWTYSGGHDTYYIYAGGRIINSVTNSGISFGWGGYYQGSSYQNGSPYWGVPYRIWGLKCPNLPTFTI